MKISQNFVAFSEYMNFIGNMYWFLIRSYKKGALKRTPPQVPLAMMLGLNYAWIFNSNDIEKEIVFQNMKLQIKQCSADHRYDKLHVKNGRNGSYEDTVGKKIAKNGRNTAI